MKNVLMWFAVKKKIEKQSDIFNPSFCLTSCSHVLPKSADSTSSVFLKFVPSCSSLLTIALVTALSGLLQ